jgi:hypothetical protein
VTRTETATPAVRFVDFRRRRREGCVQVIAPRHPQRTASAVVSSSEECRRRLSHHNRRTTCRRRGYRPVRATGVPPGSGDCSARLAGIGSRRAQLRIVCAGRPDRPAVGVLTGPMSTRRRTEWLRSSLARPRRWWEQASNDRVQQHDSARCGTWIGWVVSPKRVCQPRAGDAANRRTMKFGSSSRTTLTHREGA